MRRRCYMLDNFSSIHRRERKTWKRAWFHMHKTCPISIIVLFKLKKCFFVTITIEAVAIRLVPYITYVSVPILYLHEIHMWARQNAEIYPNDELLAQLFFLYSKFIFMSREDVDYWCVIWFFCTRCFRRYLKSWPFC